MTERRGGDVALLPEAPIRAEEVVASLPGWVAALDAGGEILWETRGLGGAGGEAADVGRPLRDLVEERHRSDLERALAEIRASGRPARVDAIVRTTGRWLRLDLAPAAGVPGAAFVATAHDVHDEKCAEEELRHNTAFLDSIVENLPDMIFVKEAADLRFVRFNRAGEELLGYPREALIGKNDYDFFPEAEADFFTAKDREVLRQGSLLDIPEEPIQTASRGQRWLHTKKIPVLDEDGKPLYLLGISEDITGRKEAAAELLRAREQAEAASRTKSIFLATMSHEIRTPLNAVLGMTELCQRTELTTEQREYLAAVQTSGEALLALIDDLLDVSKIEAGRVELERRPFDLASALQQAVRPVAPAARAKGLALTIEVDPDVPGAISGDRHRLRQIVANLVSNAIKFTAAGSVTVRVARLKEDETEVVLHFGVEDTGIGIPASQREAIFAPFAQVDQSMTRTHGGVGLGLAICRRLVDLMGGRIWVEGEEGKGSRFHFTARFGRARLEDVAEAPAGEVWGTAHDREAPPAPPLRILLAEDSELNQRLAVTLLEGWGHQVVVARNGKEALDHLVGASAGVFDLCLMDVEMPGVDGLTAIRALRAREADRGGHLPIVAMTAHAMKGDRERILAAGADGYVSKPFRASVLEGTLGRTAARFGIEGRPAARPAAPPVLDWAKAATRMGLPEAALARVSAAFAKDCRDQAAELRSALAANDLEGVRRAAHTLKGAALALGAEALAIEARALETAAEAGDATTLRERLGGLEEACSELVEALARRGVPM